MIDLRLMYELYSKELNYNINKVLKLKLTHKDNHTSLKNILNNYKEIFPVYMNTSFEDILAFTSVEDLKQLHIPVSPVYNKGKEIPFSAIKLYIEKYSYYNGEIKKLQKQIDSYKLELITYTLYKKTIMLFNSKVIDKIVNENYKFDFIPSFGSIFVCKVYNERNRVNWGISNKNKRKIEERGGTPYVKADAEKNINYTGEKYLEYHPKLDFFLEWHTTYSAKKYNSILKDYKYTPARGVSSIVSKLQMVKNNREKALALYTRTKNN